jgi:hypothetical protein
LKKNINKYIVPSIGVIIFLVLLYLSSQEIFAVLLTKNPQFENYIRVLDKAVSTITAALFFISLWLIIFQDKCAIKIQKILVSFRNKIGRVKWLFAGLIVVLPFCLIYLTRFGALVTGMPSRLVILIVAGVALAYFISSEQDRLLSGLNLCTSFFTFGLVFSLGGAFIAVTDYPFSLTWSEGNRFWDYSIMFGRDLYDFPADQRIYAYIDRGRQALWGLPFIFGRVTIWQMRLWNAILFTIPYMIFGWIVFQRFSDNKRMWLLAGLWTYLFLSQGPIYTPLILCAILVAFAWRRPWWIALPLITLAGYYAQLTRFTWMFAPAMWAGMIYISDLVEARRKNERYSVWMAISAILAGLFGAILIHRLDAFLGVQTVQQSLEGIASTADMVGINKATSTISSQALIWQRLLPSTTNETGILLLLVLITGPLLIYLVYLIQKKYWNLTLLAKIAIGTCLVLFAAAGIVISVKIGGGNNLHNLDMFLVALVFCAALAWRQRVDLRIFRLHEDPAWVQATWVTMLFIFAFFPLYHAQPLNKVPSYFSEEVLQRITQEVNIARETGEILLIDQRQLLTFGYLEDIPLIDEYEKKYIMDQAFKRDEPYFAKFRQDLRNQRFSLIISNPLNVKLSAEKEDRGFSEENDAWVQFISRPALCYYKKIVTYKDVGIELLVPVENPKPCEWDPDVP